MSAEGKKKRGESGRSNAVNIAFRYGGKPCDYFVGKRPGSAAHPRWNGTKFLAAYDLAHTMSQRFGGKWDFNTSPVMMQRLENVLTKQEA